MAKHYHNFLSEELIFFNVKNKQSLLLFVHSRMFFVLAEELFEIFVSVVIPFELPFLLGNSRIDILNHL